MVRKLKTKTVANEQFQKGQAWAANQDDPRLQYLSTLKQGDPLRVWDLDDDQHDNCSYLGLRPNAKLPVLVKRGEQVFGVEAKTVLRAEADVYRERLPGGETLYISQPLTQAEHERICHCDHQWVVYSTAMAEVWLMLECFFCGAHGSVDDPSSAEWSEAFHAPSNPYEWSDKSRVTIRGCLPNKFRHVVPIYEALDTQPRDEQ
jgi:hypothetical protein